MKPMKRQVALVAIASLASLLLGACASSAGGGGTTGVTQGGGIQGQNLSGVKFAFAIPTSAASVYVTQSKLFVDQAEKLGATVTIYDNNGDAATMLSNAQLMVAAKPDVIVEYPSAANATDRVGQIFGNANIPCIALNVPVKGCSFFNFDQPALAAMGAEAMAKQMKDRGWDSSNTTIVIGQASTLGKSVNIAVTSFYARMSELVPGMTKVSADNISPSTTSINGAQGLQADLGLTVDTGFSAMQTALQTVPKDRNVVVYPVSDDTTQGVIRALESQGRSDKAMVSGYGGELTGLNAVREGKIWVTDQIGFFPWWGEFVLAMAVAVHNGVKPPELTAPPQVVVTKDNVDTYFRPGTADLIKMPALPKDSQYLLKTGILQQFGNVEGATT